MTECDFIESQQKKQVDLTTFCSQPLIFLLGWAIGEPMLNLEQVASV